MAEPTPPEACLYCKYYRRKITDDRAMERARNAGIAVMEGVCWRFPSPVLRALADWCGEYSKAEES